MWPLFQIAVFLQSPQFGMTLFGGKPRKNPQKQAFCNVSVGHTYNLKMRYAYKTVGWK